MNSPLVSCLCLTRSRPEWLRKALECYRAQTWPNRELIIVADRDEDLGGIDFDWPDIKYVPTGPRVVGAKRNIGIGYADGEVVVHWDDDDWSAPGRVAQHVRRLLESYKAVHGYRDMKFTDGKRWFQYTGPDGFALGTSLAYERRWALGHPFEELMSGQDESFSNRAHAAGQLVLDPDCDLMYATIHPGNTSPRSLESGSAYRPLPDFQWTPAA